jgi:hypothetical protein
VGVETLLLRSVPVSMGVGIGRNAGSSKEKDIENASRSKRIRATIKSARPEMTYDIFVE